MVRVLSRKQELEELDQRAYAIQEILMEKYGTQRVKSDGINVGVYRDGIDEPVIISPDNTIRVNEEDREFAEELAKICEDVTWKSYDVVVEGLKSWVLGAQFGPH